MIYIIFAYPGAGIGSSTKTGIDWQNHYGSSTKYSQSETSISDIRGLGVASSLYYNPGFADI